MVGFLSVRRRALSSRETQAESALPTWLKVYAVCFFQTALLFVARKGGGSQGFDGNVAADVERAVADFCLHGVLMM